VDESLILPGDFTTPTGYLRAKQILQMDPRPTAIFAANDQSALGVYQAAEELGIRIPGELSLLGFDNISEASFLGLTTIDQNLPEMGYVATQMLIKLVNDEPVDVRTYKVPTNLLIRDSCSAVEEPDRSF